MVGVWADWNDVNMEFPKFNEGFDFKKYLLNVSGI